MVWNYLVMDVCRSYFVALVFPMCILSVLLILDVCSCSCSICLTHKSPKVQVLLFSSVVIDFFLYIDTKIF